MNEKEVNTEIQNTKFKRYQLILKNLRDNLPLGIAFATILGGINQYYNLLSIGPYYVRFFSVTQLLSDGLWIMYLLVPFYFIIVIMFPFIIAKDDFYIGAFNPNDKKGIFDREKVIINNSLVIIIVYPVCYYFIITGVWPYASILLLMYTFPAVMANFKLGQKFKKEIVFDIFSTISFLSFLSSIYFTWIWAFKNNDIPSNLLNSIKIEKIIESTHPTFNYKILYMNDKYIFSKIYCDSINDPNAKIFLLPAESFINIEETAANSR